MSKKNKAKYGYGEQMTFADIFDELNWAAVKMSEGNVEAVSEFVQNRNEIRQRKEASVSQDLGMNK